VKDLIKSLRRENDTCDIRRFLGTAQVLQNDLIPLAIHYCLHDDELFDVTIRYVDEPTSTYSAKIVLWCLVLRQVTPTNNFTKEAALVSYQCELSRTIILVYTL